MGMYTELYIAVEIKKDTPEDVINILKYLFDHDRDDFRTEPENLPGHDFFKCERWMCIGSMASFYFQPKATSKFYKQLEYYFITSRSDLKNYDGEIKKFLDWVMPYIEAYDGDHLGHYRYEENDQPTLIFYKDPESKGE